MICCYVIRQNYAKCKKIFLQGIMIRTRATWIAEGGKNSRYIFNLEKRNYERKHFQKLEKDDTFIVF